MAKPAPPRVKATYADLARLGDGVIGEILAGELVATPRPANVHSAASFSLSGQLDGPFQRGRGGPGGWHFLFEPELHLGDDVLVPDVAGWRVARLPVIPDTAFVTLAPD